MRVRGVMTLTLLSSRRVHIWNQIPHQISGSEQALISTVNSFPCSYLRQAMTFTSKSNRFGLKSNDYGDYSWDEAEI